MLVACYFFASVGMQLGFGLSYKRFVTEGSQIIAYQLLTLPLWVDPLSPPTVLLAQDFIIIIIIIIIDQFYTVLFSALEQTHCAHVACDSQWATTSYSFFWQHIFQYPTKLCTDNTIWLLHHTWLVLCETAAISVQVYTIQPCTSLHCHFIQRCTFGRMTRMFYALLW